MRIGNPYMWWSVALLALVGLAAGLPTAQGAVLTSVRPSLVDESFRLELVLTQETAHRVWRTQSPARVIVDVQAELSQHLPPQIQLNNLGVLRVRIGAGPLGVRVVLDLRYALPIPVVTRERDALVVTVPLTFRSVEETHVRPGVWFGSVRAGEVHGPVSVKYLRVDPSHPDVSLGVRLADTEFRLRPLRDIVQGVSAFGGVNGGYFHWSGMPLGLVVQSGRLLAEDTHARTALLIGDDGRAHIGRQRVEMWLEAPGVTIPVDGINRARQSGEVVVYTPEYGRPIQGPGVRRAVADGMTAVFDEGLQPLSSLNERVVPTFGFRLVPGAPAGVREALGGGPQLVADGEIAVTGVEERFQPDVLLGRAPRTAVGVTAEGHVFLLVVDGRNGDVSVGATLHELAGLMRDLGAVSAMNLDGGGSSTLVLRGMVLNQPSSGEERPIGSALLLHVHGDF